MNLLILGSGTNVHPRRAAAGYLVGTDHPLLLDFGPRTLSNLIKAGIDRHKIRHILFSHFHADHFADFIPFFFDAVYYARFVGRRPPLTLIGPPGARRLFHAIFKTFPSFSDAPFRVTVREVGDRPFRLGDTRIMPRTVLHSTRLHCLGYRLEYRGKVMVYSGDAQYCDNLVRLCGDADVAVLDCSFPANRPGPNHMHAEDCGRVAQEAGVRRTILSHFYPIAERFDVRTQAARRYRGRITLARDLLSLSL
jgi:ribonuclease BN (tRNA processing enzyme)